MATKFKQEGHESELMMFQECVLRYHSEYRKEYEEGTPRHRRRMLERVLKGHLSMGLVMEETAVYCSQEVRSRSLKHVSVDGMDFDDGSDMKTMSLRYEECPQKLQWNKQYKKYYLRKAHVRVRGTLQNLQVKRGAIRVVVYNVVTKRLDYFFLPPQWLNKRKRKHKQKNSKAKKLNYTINANLHTGAFKPWKKFQCKDFSDLMSR